ncbi:hypothetical protein MRX96_043178 [Rhipicephalus microplus]
MMPEDQRQRRWWVRPSWRTRHAESEFFTTMKKMRAGDLEYFKKYYRMSPSQFDYILSLVKEDLERETFIREPISSAERLAMTLSSECIEAGPSSRAHDPSREHLNQSADSICTTELVEIHVPLRKQYDYLEFRLPAFGPYEEVLQRGEPVEGPVRRAIVQQNFSSLLQNSMVSFEGAVQHSSGTAYSEVPAPTGQHQKRDRHGIVETCTKKQV